VRPGEIYIEPGYDGAFGVVEVFSEKERTDKMFVQQSLV
jgi:hypothetical protein